MANFNLKKGYDLKLEGEPQKEIVSISASDIIQVNPQNFKYIKPKVTVKVDDLVQVGSLLFFDKNNPNIHHVSPCSGKVKNIDYGEKRKVLSINIENDKQYTQVELKNLDKLYSLSSIKNLSNDSTKKIINEAGMWPLIRQRPFSKIADIDSKPKSIFISMKPTDPLAVDQLFVLEHNSVGFIEGIDVLSNLTDGDIFLNLKKASTFFDGYDLGNVKVNYFNGPHPSGNIGVHPGRAFGAEAHLFR